MWKRQRFFLLLSVGAGKFYTIIDTLAGMNQSLPEERIEQQVGKPRILFWIFPRNIE